MTEWSEVLLSQAVQLTIDLQKCNLHSFPFPEINLEEAYATMDFKNCQIQLQKTPPYLNRGRYQFWVVSKDPRLFTIDGNDGFPRYFFNLQRAIDELKDWYDFNIERINAE